MDVRRSPRWGRGGAIALRAPTWSVRTALSLAIVGLTLLAGVLPMLASGVPSLQGVPYIGGLSALHAPPSHSSSPPTCYPGIGPGLGTSSCAPNGRGPVPSPTPSPTGGVNRPQGAGTVILNIPVGSGPYGIAYDSGKNEVFVGDYYGDAVNVINAATQTVVATIPLGSGNGPTGMTYDSLHGYIYTANIGAGTVSIISDTTNTLLATVNVGYSPWGIAYDSRNGYVYVANDGAGTTVRIFNGLSIIGSVVVGSSPDGVTYDGENGYVYTANSGSRTLTVISGATNTVVATLMYGSWFPYWVAYGARSGDVYVADAGGPYVYVVSGYTNALVKTIGVPSAQTEMAYDSGNNDAYATGCGGSSVMVIDGSSNTYLTSIATGSGPCGVTYDTLNGDLYVANIGSNTVSVISTSNPQATVPSASPTSVDLGQSTTFSTTPTGGVPPYTYVWNGLPPGCVSASTTNLICAPTGAGTFRVSVSITDSTGYTSTSGSLTFHVYLDPTVTTPVATPGSADVNQSLSFNTTVGNGTGTYTSYTWTESSPNLGCVLANAAPIACAPKVTGTYTTTVLVTDSNGCSSGSPGVCAGSPTTSVPVSVYPDPVVGPPTASPSIIDAGQTVNFTSAVPVGGLAPFSYRWNGLPSGCVSSATSRDTCTPGRGGLFNISVSLTDANGYVVNSPKLAYLVNSTLSVNLTASAPTVDVGQTLVFSTSVSFGSPPFSYVWSGPAGLGCSPSGAPSLSCVPTSPGTYQVTVTVSDHAGKHISASLSVTVGSDPVVKVKGGNQTDVGRTIRLLASASGGFSPYSYLWGYVSGLGCVPPTSTNLTCTPATVGIYAVALTLKDSVGMTDTLAISISVNPPPTVGINGPKATDESTAILFLATPAGGTAPFNYTWSAPSGMGCSPSTNTTMSCVPTAAGSLVVKVDATDSVGSTATQTWATLVSPVPALTLAGPGSGVTGTSFVLNAEIKGGTAPFAYNWSYPSFMGCASSVNATLSCTPAFAGTDVVNVTITDAVGKTASAQVTIRVTAAVVQQSPPAANGLNSVVLLLYLILIALVAMVILLAFRQRGRARAREGSSEEDGGPVPSTPSAAAPPSSSGGGSTVAGAAGTEMAVGGDVGSGSMAAPTAQEVEPSTLETGPGSPPPMTPAEVAPEVHPGPPPMEEVAPGPPAFGTRSSVNATCADCGAEVPPGRNCPVCGSPGPDPVSANEPTAGEAALQSYLDNYRPAADAPSTSAPPSAPKASPPSKSPPSPSPAPAPSVVPSPSASLPPPLPPPLPPAAAHPPGPAEGGPSKVAHCPQCGMPLPGVGLRCANCDLLTRNLQSGLSKQPPSG